MRAYLIGPRVVARLFGAFAFVLLPQLAHAENCTSSREYILAGEFGDLPQSPQSYQDLFKMCLQTLELSNVKDAFVLKGGAVAVVPRDSSLIATANTLAQFCQRYPNGRLRFVGRGEREQNREIGQIVRLSANGATPCQDIKRERF
jgi:hypothetical protein